MNRRWIYLMLSVACGASAIYLWSKRDKPVDSKPGEKPPETTSQQNPADKPEDKLVPEKTPATKQKPTPASGKAPAIKPKPVSADSMLQSKGDTAVNGKVLTAKSAGAGIYDTTFKKVATTTAGELLGKAFKANKQGNGTWMIKYTDAVGNYRIVNSASVNVI